ncbi:hypothetical protein PVL29_021344 [Vitis rotundifolia]|uniref:Glycosyl transferase CAP10 domain-containing protein n=1 Tax=Vitis rotundifolia TaxID=103349 RepID=A0AA39DEL4_VITRO|nr:hypothetical protein PVL29_021344 [Vitis rotundifolia]
MSLRGLYYLQSLPTTAVEKPILPTGTAHKPLKIPKKPPVKIEYPLNCSAGYLTRTCPRNYPTAVSPEDPDRPSPPECPHYFRWIYGDLRPWMKSGITREMVERTKRTATFKLVILNGRAYVEKYQRAFQTRDVFMLWGILQLLRRYPEKVPDLELMFDCVDWPVIKSKDYHGPNATAPPPLFRYCGDDATLDIPWESLLKDLKEGNKRSKWMEREPYTYDWIRESQEGYKQSDLASQCIHRYKIYIEGSAWSVSQKYILACDSVTLLVNPHYYDFFTRSLMPVHHYWPIREDDKCRSIKFAVDWGNRHKQKAQSIGKAASDFIQEDLKMDNVYDYMFHLLNEYAMLLKFKPTVPEKAVELCSERMGCGAEGLKKKFTMESMVKYPMDASPCTMPPPFSPLELQTFLKRKVNSIKQVEAWEKKFWENQNT